MTGTTTRILGGGFAGLSTAYHLRPRLGPEHRIIVPERSSTFTIGAANTWVMLGQVAPEDVQHSRAALAARFDGKGCCFIETAPGKALRGDGSFCALPRPEMAFSEPDATQLEAKKRWVLDFVRTYLG